MSSQDNADPVATEDRGRKPRNRRLDGGNKKTDNIRDSPSHSEKSRTKSKMPSIPKLATCCCFVNLETGVKILGYIETVLGLLGTLIYGLVLGGAIDLSEEKGFSTEEPPVNGTMPSSTPPTVTEEELSPGILVVVLIGTIFMATIGILVLLGVYQRNPAFLKLSVIARCIILAYFGLSIFANLIALAMGVETQFTAVIIFTLIVGYNTLVVYSYYMEMQPGTGNY